MGSQMVSNKGMAVIFFSLCMLAIAVTPATALHTGRDDQIRELRWANDELKEELWQIHAEYRLGIFDLRLNRTDRILDALDRHGYNTASARELLEEIEAKRPQLADALVKRDTRVLREVNRELAGIWRELGKSLKSAIFRNR